MLVLLHSKEVRVLAIDTTIVSLRYGQRTGRRGAEGPEYPGLADKFPIKKRPIPRFSPSACSGDL